MNQEHQSRIDVVVNDTLAQAGLDQLINKLKTAQNLASSITVGMGGGGGGGAPAPGGSHPGVTTTAPPPTSPGTSPPSASPIPGVSPGGSGGLTAAINNLASKIEEMGGGGEGGSGSTGDGGDGGGRRRRRRGPSRGQSLSYAGALAFRGGLDAINNGMNASPGAPFDVMGGIYKTGGAALGSLTRMIPGIGRYLGPVAAGAAEVAAMYKGLQSKGAGILNRDIRAYGAYEQMAKEGAAAGMPSNEEAQKAIRTSAIAAGISPSSAMQQAKSFAQSLGGAKGPGFAKIAGIAAAGVSPQSIAELFRTGIQGGGGTHAQAVDALSVMGGSARLAGLKAGGISELLQIVASNTSKMAQEGIAVDPSGVAKMAQMFQTGGMGPLQGARRAAMVSQMPSNAAKKLSGMMGLDQLADQLLMAEVFQKTDNPFEAVGMLQEMQGSQALQVFAASGLMRETLTGGGMSQKEISAVFGLGPGGERAPLPSVSGGTVAQRVATEESRRLERGGEKQDMFGEMVGMMYNIENTLIKTLPADLKKFYGKVNKIVDLLGRLAN